ncbi:MAG: hypothetical protein QOI51_2173 [Nocardioidaceae bacterium]|jgi:hypothetical protein|nr:hypothetical protein [Nocardioidaceae bacterium]
MSSHREAPETAKDPVADNTDTYAFVSPDAPDTVTLISNYIPFEGPDGGPNFYEFGEDVLYLIHVDNDGDGKPDVSYQFEFTVKVENEDTFLYNTGVIDSISSPKWNRKQFYTVTKVLRWGTDDARSTVLADHVPCPPCNVGVRSTPNYGDLAAAAIHHLRGGGKVFAGQRKEGFYVDLGSIFDLLVLRPFQHLHLIPMADSPGVNGSQGVNVHSIAIQVPITDLTRNGARPSGVNDPKAVIAVFAAAYRRKLSIRRDRRRVESGPWVQVSRLGNPLFNEVVVPMGDKDRWNAVPPSDDGQFAHYVAHPEVAKLLPVLYPGVFPHLAALTAARADLLAILMTGIPKGIIDGFQNYTGAKQFDALRLNVAIKPSKKPSIFGILGGDLAGFPNGRRVPDDVTAIELRAIAGATYPLVNPSYTPDAAAGVITDGLTPKNTHQNYPDHFPYLATPLNGFDNPS